MTDEAVAFVPGHVTGFFTVHRDEEDPTKTGSQGAGLTLAEGVTVRARVADRPEVLLNDDSVDMPAVDRVLRTLDAPARIEAETDLPIGAGFGVSGAMALGTALAVNAAYDRQLSENELVTIAHGAEVEAGSGLGDVVAQARGGAPIRLEPGGPQHNKIDAIPRRTRVEYVSYGGLSTDEVIGGDTDELTRAGKEALSLVVQEPTLPSFVYASRRFAVDADLLTPRVQETIQDVSESGGEASMAMLGQTVFALGSGLSEAGYDPVVTKTHQAGAYVK